MLPTHAPRRIRCRNVALALSLALAAGACQRGADPDSLVASAEQYRARGEIRAAVIELKNAIQKEPDKQATRLLLGQVYLDQGDGISAEKELRRALSLGAPRSEVELPLGASLLIQGHFQQLLDEMQDGVDAQRPARLALRGNALLGLAQIEPARAMFKEAQGLDPALPAALLGLARIAMSERHPEQARALIASALKAVPAEPDCLRFKGDMLRADGDAMGALALYRQVLALRPGSAQAHVDVANILIDTGKLDQAQAELDLARKVSPGIVAVFYAQALLDFRQGKNAAALDSLQQILRVAPDHLPSALLAGAVQLALNSPQQAELHLRKFLTAYPHHVHASKLMAAIRIQANDPDGALALLLPALDQAGDDVDLLTAAGEAHLRARRFTNAAEYFEKASALNPKQSMLHTALALSRLGSGENARAVAELEHASALDPAAARPGVLLVMSYLRANESDKALAAVTELQKQGDNPLLQNLKGGVYLTRSDLKQARKCFEQALVLDPLYLPALDNAAQLDMLEKRPEQAKQRYTAALQRSRDNPQLMEAMARFSTRYGSTAEAMGWLERAHQARPEDLALALRLADFYQRAGKPEAALRLAQRLKDANPAHPDALSMLAQAQLANRNPGAAADTYATLALLIPESAHAQLRLAATRLQLKDEAGALQAARKASAIAPGLAQAREIELRVLLGQKRFPEALAVAAAEQKRQPGSGAGFAMEGDIQMAHGQPALALRPYERALALAPAAPAAIALHTALVKAGKPGDADARMLGWFKAHPDDVPSRLYYASSKMVRHDLKGAVEQYDIALRLEPNNVVALNDVAWARHEMKDKQALAYAERALRAAPQNPVVMDTLGWIVLEQGQAARALALLKQASALAPQASDIRYHLGVALARSGDKAGARRELERLLASSADFARRADAKAVLATL